MSGMTEPTKTARKARGRPAGYSREKYLQALATYLLKESPEYVADLLSGVDRKWRRAFEAEMQRQRGAEELGSDA